MGLDKTKFKTIIRSCDISRRYITAQVCDDLVTNESFWIITAPYILCYIDKNNSFTFNKDIPIEQPLTLFNSSANYSFLASKVVDSRVFSEEIATKSLCTIFSLKANLLIETNPNNLKVLLKQQNPELVSTFSKCIDLIPSHNEDFIKGILYTTFGKDAANDFKYLDIKEQFKKACDNIKDFAEDIGNAAIKFFKSEKKDSW